MPQIVVEADGSAYPCDFYALDEYRVGNMADEPIDAIYAKAAPTLLSAAVGVPACAVRFAERRMQRNADSSAF